MNAKSVLKTKIFILIALLFCCPVKAGTSMIFQTGKLSSLIFAVSPEQIKADMNSPTLVRPPSMTISREHIEDQLIGFDEIVFTVRQVGADGHWYANFSYYANDENRKAYRQSAKLCKLNWRTGKVTTLLEDPTGSVRDPQVHYDGKKIIFSYRKGSADNFSLYEINTDGKNLTRITYGKYDDIEPTYLADDTIIFGSSRCKRWVNCWLTQTAILYRCDADGTNVRQLSSNNEHENTLWPLPDGRILYTRWEYVDRSQVDYHHLWTTNPDGTNHSIYYGNLRPGTVMIDAKPIPETDNVLAVFSRGHGLREHRGAIAIVSPKAGPDEEASAKVISKDGRFRDPYPVSQNSFIVARGSELGIMEPSGKVEYFYRLPKHLTDAGFELHEPRPIVARTRERIIPSRIDQSSSTGKLILVNVYKGRNMEGVKPGEIKKLLVLETLPKPINYTGGMDPLSYGGTFTLERILGTVPVEEDGSAYMELPANRGLFFVALDEKDRSVKRMQSFLTVRPGETTSCMGCHEQRTTSASNINAPVLKAVKRKPSKIQPIEGIADVIDFPRDIQPILDEHCLKCHDYQRQDYHEPRQGDIVLSGDHGPMFSHSYINLIVNKQISDGRNRPQSNYPPRTIGSSASPLMHLIDEDHQGAKLSDRQRRIMALWIDTGATYPGTYAALGNGMVGGYAENVQNHTDYAWPSTKRAANVMEQRCISCHTDSKRFPHSQMKTVSFSGCRILTTRQLNTSAI